MSDILSEEELDEKLEDITDECIGGALRESRPRTGWRRSAKAEGAITVVLASHRALKLERDLILEGSAKWQEAFNGMKGKRDALQSEVERLTKAVEWEQDRIVVVASQRDDLADDLRRAEKELGKWEEREGGCCPEDTPFKEVIAALRKRLEDLEDHNAELKSIYDGHKEGSHALAEDPDVNEWCNVTSRIRQAGEALKSLRAENTELKAKMQQFIHGEEHPDQYITRDEANDLRAELKKAREEVAALKKEIEQMEDDSWHEAREIAEDRDSTRE